MRRCDQPPRFMRALFTSTCPETGRALERGDVIVYFPDQRKAYHRESQHATQARAMGAAARRPKLAATRLRATSQRTRAGS